MIRIFRMVLAISDCAYERCSTEVDTVRIAAMTIVCRTYVTLDLEL